MIDHRQAQALAATAIDFPLDATDRDNLDAHLRGCSSCRAELAAYQKDAARLAALPPIVPPTWVRGTIGRARRPNPFVLLAAAALLLAASAGLTVMVGSALRNARNADVPPSVAVLPSPDPTTPVSSPPELTPSPAPATPAGLLLFMQTEPTYDAYQMVRVVSVSGRGLHDLEHGFEASWSADGRLIHIVSQDADCVPSLITEAPDGSGRVTANRVMQSGDFGFAWSPDERQVVFVRYRVDPGSWQACSFVGTGPPSTMDLWVMNADGSAARVLVKDFQLSGAPAFAWSPDSTRIAFVARSKFPTLNGLYGYSIAFVRVGDGRRTDSGISSAEAGETGLAWSPDGTRLAAALTHDAASGLVGIRTFPADPTSDTPIDLTTGNPVAPATRLGAPIWSPDGTTIAVTSQIVGSDGTITGGDILLLDAVKGGLLRDLAVTDADGPGSPTWSADSRWIAYVSEIHDATGIHPGPIVEVAIDGNDRRVLTGTSPTAADFVDGVTSVAWQPAP
jgi:Tol biopolymer transport system component